MRAYLSLLAAEASAPAWLPWAAADAALLPGKTACAPRGDLGNAFRSVLGALGVGGALGGAACPRVSTLTVDDRRLLYPGRSCGCRCIPCPLPAPDGEFMLAED